MSRLLEICLGPPVQSGRFAGRLSAPILASRVIAVGLARETSSLPKEIHLPANCSVRLNSRIQS